MNFEIIETERLFLRKLTNEDYENILLNLSDDEIIKYLNVKPENIEKEKQKAKAGFATYNKKKCVFQLIEKKTEQILGFCGYHIWFIDHDHAEIGYSLDKNEHKNKGFMTEALEAIIEYGFREMKLNRIEALLAEYNVPSLKLVNKFGFKQEGVLRKHYLVNGKYEDSLIFSLLQDEYGHKKV